MQEELFTINNFVSAEIVEKKSRFIASIKHIESEEEALAFIADVKKEHSQARHNVYAYIVAPTRDRAERIRFSDDGEPSHTAGLPTLDTLKYAKLANVSCVVTRYFGGTLLGTGGLVRAYSGAVRAAVQKAIEDGAIIEIGNREMKEFVCPISDFEKQKSKIEASGGSIETVEFGLECKIRAMMPRED